MLRNLLKLIHETRRRFFCYNDKFKAELILRAATGVEKDAHFELFSQPWDANGEEAGSSFQKALLVLGHEIQQQVHI